MKYSEGPHNARKPVKVQSPQRNVTWKKLTAGAVKGKREEVVSEPNEIVRVQRGTIDVTKDRGTASFLEDAVDEYEDDFEVRKIIDETYRRPIRG